MTFVLGDRRKGLASRPLREYYSRVLGYLACAAGLAAGTHTQFYSMDQLWLVPYALLYPHLAYHLSYRFRREHAERTAQVLLCLDGLNAGAAMALLGFSRCRASSSYSSSASAR